MAASVAGPIERQFSTIAGISSMTSQSALGQTQVTIQFDLNRDIDGAALDVQTALAVAQRRLPVEMTTPPFFRKVNPGDFPVLYHQPELADAAAVDGGRIRRDAAGAADFAAPRRRPGAGLRLAEIRRPRPGRSGGGGGAQHLARRRAHRPVQGQFQHAGRHPVGAGARRHAGRVGRHAPGLGLQERRRGLAQRRAGQAHRDRQRHRQRRERQGRELVQRCPRRRAGDPAPARRQHRRGGRPGEGQAAAVPRPGAAVDPHGDAARPLDLDPRTPSTDVQETLAIAFCARHPGHLPVPALGHGHHHSRRSRCRSRWSAPAP